MTILIILSIIHIFIFTLALCLAAQRGDAAMEAFFVSWKNSHEKPPTIDPNEPTDTLQMGCFPADGKSVFRRAADWANAPLRANTRRHSLVQWLVRSRQLQ